MGFRGKHGREHLSHWKSGNGKDDVPAYRAATKPKAHGGGGTDGCGGCQCRRHDHPFVLPTAPLSVCSRKHVQAAFRLLEGEEAHHPHHRSAGHRRDFDGTVRLARRHRQRDAPFPRPATTLRGRTTAAHRRLAAAHAGRYGRRRGYPEPLLRHSILLRFKGIAADTLCHAGAEACIPPTGRGVSEHPQPHSCGPTHSRGHCQAERKTLEQDTIRTDDAGRAEPVRRRWLFHPADHAQPHCRFVQRERAAEATRAAIPLPSPDRRDVS